MKYLLGISGQVVHSMMKQRMCEIEGRLH